MPADLEIVDAHHHLWDLANHYPWLSEHPEPDFLLGDYTALKRNYLPDDYRIDAHGLKVVATVHVEAEHDRARPGDETAWLHQIHAQYGMPNAVVAHAFLHSDDLEEKLAAHEKFPLVRGIRCKPVREGPGSLHDPNWRRGMKLLEKHGLSWDLRVPFWHLEDAARRPEGLARRHEGARGESGRLLQDQRARLEERRLDGGRQPPRGARGDRDLRHRALHVRLELSRRRASHRLPRADLGPAQNSRGRFQSGIAEALQYNALRFYRIRQRA